MGVKGSSTNRRFYKLPKMGQGPRGAGWEVDFCSRCQHALLDAPSRRNKYDIPYRGITVSSLHLCPDFTSPPILGKKVPPPPALPLLSWGRGSSTDLPAPYLSPCSFARGHPHLSTPRAPVSQSEQARSPNDGEREVIALQGLKNLPLGNWLQGTFLCSPQLAGCMGLLGGCHKVLHTWRLRQQKCALAQCWRLEVQDQGSSRTVLPPEERGQSSLLVSSSFWGLPTFLG